MARSAQPLAHGFWMAVLVALPFLVALAMLLLLYAGWVTLGPALAVTGGLALAAVLMVLWLRQDGLKLLDYLERLERGALRRERVPRARTELGRLAVGHLARLSRQSARRLARLQRERDVALTVIEAIPDPLLLLNGERRVVRANSAARRQFGDAVVDRDLALTIRNPAVLEAVDAVTGGAASRTVEIDWSVPVAQSLEVRVTPFARPDNEVLIGGEEGVPDEPRDSDPDGPATLVLFHDITAIRRAEQMRADFVANASHELRTPLASLIGFIETLQGPARDDPEAQRRFLEIMQRQADRMSRLIGDLLSLSRIELDEHTLPEGRVDLAAVVRSVATGLELRACDRGMTLRVAVADALPMIQGETDQLTQVFQNLMDNALSYGRTGTEVTVTLAPVGPPGRPTGISVAVRDRGIGIAREHIPRLTERFYRADPARSKAAGGTGLGLAIVKHIVSRHRGRLTIDSVPGEGSTFTVQFPAALPVLVRPVQPARKLSS